MERNVTLNHDQGLYVIHENQGGYSHLGFDVCLDRIERYAIELVGRGALPGDYLDDTLAKVKATRGTLATYDIYVSVMELLHVTCDEQGERAVADLSPQLTGLEGHRVEVVDEWGEKRRFIVGKSTGWLPVHLEIARRDSSGGPAAWHEYKSVRVLEKVR